MSRFRRGWNHVILRDFMTISLTEPFPAIWNHDNSRFFVSGAPFWIDWCAVWGWRVHREAASDRNLGVVLVDRRDSAVDHSFALDQPDGIQE